MPRALVLSAPVSTDTRSSPWSRLHSIADRIRADPIPAPSVSGETTSSPMQPSRAPLQCFLTPTETNPQTEPSWSATRTVWLSRCDPSSASRTHSVTACRTAAGSRHAATPSVSRAARASICSLSDADAGLILVDMVSTMPNEPWLKKPLSTWLLTERGAASKHLKSVVDSYHDRDWRKSADPRSAANRRIWRRASPAFRGCGKRPRS